MVQRKLRGQGNKSSRDRGAEFIPTIGAGDLIERDLDDLVIERPCLEIIQNSEVIESVQVINGMVPGNITRALNGEHVSTIIFKQPSKET